jgi:hypothetical protein
MSTKESSIRPDLLRKSSLLQGLASNPSFNAKFQNLTASMNPMDFEDKHKSKLETFRLATKEFLNNTLFGHIYTQFLLTISVLSCFQFIWQTYLPAQSTDEDSLLGVFAQLELSIAILFVMDWIILFFVSDHKYTYLTRFANFIIS